MRLIAIAGLALYWLIGLPFVAIGFVAAGIVHALGAGWHYFSAAIDNAADRIE